jgi:branched-chain amino acid transport system permease protein
MAVGSYGYCGRRGFFAFLCLALYDPSQRSRDPKKEADADNAKTLPQQLITNPKFSRPALAIVGVFFIVYPLLFSLYQIDIMTTALIYVVVALGLNIVVGLAGLLDLGYVAFFAVGAYCYALLNYHFGMSFWVCLPIGGALGFTFGVLLGFPVLRLRGDYLAIVTLGLVKSSG